MAACTGAEGAPYSREPGRNSLARKTGLGKQKNEKKDEFDDEET